MALNGNNYPTTPASSGVAAPTMGTAQAKVASLAEYDNTEIEVVSIARGATKLLSTLISLGRQANDGKYDEIGLSEEVSVNYPTYKFKEQDLAKVVFNLSVAALAGDTTVTLTTTAGLYAGMVLRNVTTNEHVRINTVASGTTLTIARAVGTVAAAAIATTDKLLVVGTATARGAYEVGETYAAAVDVTNYFQKHLTTVSLTDEDILKNGGPVFKVDRFIKDKAIEHMLGLERIALFGQKFSGTDVNGNPFYSAEGVIQFAKRGWTDDISSGLSRTTLEYALANPMRYTKNGIAEKIVLCGSKAKAVISNLFEGRLNVTDIKNIDLRLDTVETNGGKYMFIDHPMLDADSGYEGHIIVLDPRFLKVVYPSGKDLQGAAINGKTKFTFDAASSHGAFIQKGSWSTYLTFANQNANSAAIFKIV